MPDSTPTPPASIPSSRDHRKPAPQPEPSGRPVVLRGSIRRAVLILALPVLGEELLNSLVGIVDVFLAGRISVQATAAIGLGAYVEWLISMLFMLVGMGTTALVARFYGARDSKRVAHYANQSLATAVGLGLAAFALIYALAPWFAHLQNMTGETADIVVRYLRIDSIGHVFTSFSLIGAAALRGVGDMRTPLKILGLVNLLNMGVSYALTFGIGPFPAMGIDGIVTGTVVSRFAGGVVTVLVLARRSDALKISLRDAIPVIQSVKRITRIGFPAAIDGAVMWAGHFVFLMIIARLSDATMATIFYAAHIIGVRIEALTYLPAVAWSKAAATIVGQSLGAGKRRRALQAGHEAVFQCAMLGLALTVFYYFGAQRIFAVMQDDGLVGMVGAPALRMLAFFQVFLMASIIYVGAMRGAGDTRFPLIITLVSVLGVRLPLGYMLGLVCGFGLIGAWAAMGCDIAVRATFAWLRFRRGKWRETRI